ncbi:MAG: PKD domain-containing protein [Bacteroidia bacterium]|nr:PKD domain-containing protein [Bacteroidia bacterium]
MRNILYFIFVSFFLLSTPDAKAQCLPAVFSVSDTACPGQNLVIDNSASGALSFNWDFCLGDLDSMPAAQALPSIGGTLSYPTNMKLVKVDGLYYGFIANAFGGNYITRYNFGTSLANAPSAVNLDSDPLLGNVTSGIELVQEGNKWYMFLTTFSSNSLLRYEMDSITQTNPVLSNLNVSGLASPASIKVLNGYAFITNNQGLDITRLDFGGSYQNIPSVLSPSIYTGFFGNFGIDIAYDCRSNKYIGFSTSAGNGIVFKLDFGTALSNLPLVSTAANSLWTAQGLQLAYEDENWHLFMVSESNNFYHFTSGISLDSPLVQQYSTNFGGIMANPHNIQLAKDGSDWIGIIPNKLLFSIVRVQFPQGCSGAALSSSDQSPTGISFPASNTGYNPFQLTETMANGDLHYYSDSVYVHIPPPEAAFSSSAACTNSDVNFSDNSSVCYGNITGWNWDFGDGNGSNSASPGHTYTTAGTYTVVLKVYSSNGDSASVQQSITVHEPPQAWYSRPDSACVGADISFTDSSTCNDGNLLQWTWDFGDTGTGIGNPVSHAYALAGSYPVQLIATSDFGCSDTVIRSMNIIPGPLADFQLFNTCEGETAQFINLTTASGTSISANTWDFGDGNSSNLQDPNHTYPNGAAQYTVQLISESVNGCKDTLLRTIRIANRPHPWFQLNADTVCTYTFLQFNDSSFAGAGDTITKRIWDFGDGTMDSTSIDPTHAYVAPGTYTVTLRVLSPDDCDSTVTRNVFVIESPTAGFISSHVCFGIENIFTDTSSSPTGSSLSSWHWNFGDGDSSLNSNTQHTYSGPGSYTVSLIVGSTIGCFDTLTRQILVYELPQAAFGFEKACTDAPVQFTDSSTVNGSNITGWTWDFGIPGATSTLQHPTYIYPSPLAYQVNLIVNSAQGCSDTLSRFLTVDQTPEFTISHTDQCKGISSSFMYVPAPGTNSNLSFLWNFGDSTASFLPNPVHLFSNAGEYHVVLSVTDLDNGCIGSVNDTVNVHPLPRANFLFSNTCLGESTPFFDSSSIANGSISSWAWTFGTNASSTLSNPVYTFNQTGSVPVKLVVSSDQGCQDSIQQTIIIHELPQVSFAASTNYGAPPLPVQFTNSSDPGIYTWNFGDNSALSTATSPLHQYLDTGLYTSTLTVTNLNGCIDSASQTIFVLIPRPDLGLTGVSFNKINGFWIMKASVANTGNEDAYEFELKAHLGGEQVFYNTFNKDTLKAAQIKEFTFNTKLEAGPASPPFFCAEVITVNNKQDVNPSNDRFCRSSGNQFEIFNVYPNPFQDVLFAGINMVRKGEIRLMMTDINGRRISEEMIFNLQEGFNTIQVPTDKLASAIYILKVSYGDADEYFRISKY